MSERTIDPRLQKLYDEGTPVYSISRLDCINRCPYEAYLTYVKHEKGEQNIYALLGTRIHDVLEQIMNNEATESDLLPAMTEELDDAALFGYEFPKDSKGNDTIRNGWIANMTNFCETYRAPKRGTFKTEEFVLYKTPNNHYVQGYLDLQKLMRNDIISIFDYKTSTLYKGDDLKEHGRQLVLYALAKEQEGFQVRSVNWIFLKYVEITLNGKKTARSKEKTEIKKVCERRKIGQELSRFVADDLRDLGYGELDIQDICESLEETNKVKMLPEEIKDLYRIVPYVCNYELTDELRRECIDYIDGTIDRWESMTEYPPKDFAIASKTGKVKEDTFFCSQLCGHNKKCPYIKAYFDKKLSAEVDDDLFA